jgi:hypothetical protein
MSNLFSQIQGGGIKFPDAKINQGGPLPSTSNPAVHYTTAKINQTDALLSNLDAYDYGDHKYTSDDIAYQNIPVKIQKIIPVVKLPSARDLDGDYINVSHPVDDGDLAFVLKIKESKEMVINGIVYFEKRSLGRAIDCVVNLPTVNYILRGLQTRFEHTDKWAHFLSLFDTDIHIEHFQSEDPRIRQNACELFVRDCIAPFGVVIGSEHQGGQHEGTNMAVDWPVNFVATVCVDGFNENMVNIWRRCQVGAGDQLMLILARECWTTDAVSKTMQTRADKTCNLNHYFKGRISQTFDHWDDKAFQLVPTTNRECNKGEIFRNFYMQDNERRRCASLGMWHIATSQVMSNMVGNATSRVSFSSTSGMSAYLDDMQNVKAGALLQTTVAPVWQPTLHQGWLARVCAALSKKGLNRNNAASQEHRKMVNAFWQYNHVPCFGAKLPAEAASNHAELFQHVLTCCNNDHDEAYDTTADILAHVVGDSRYVSHHEDADGTGSYMMFTREAHDLIEGLSATDTTQADTPNGQTHASLQNAAPVRKPVVPMFQQVAAQQKAAAENVVASKVATPPQPETTRKRKGPATVSNSATALNTETSTDKDDTPSVKISGKMQL